LRAVVIVVSKNSVTLSEIVCQLEK
jgi:hypothetical protein